MCSLPSADQRHTTKVMMDNISSTPEPLIEVLAALFPALIYLRTPNLRPTKSRDHLVNLLLATAKVAIWNTREERLAGGGACNCGAVFRCFVCSHIRAEFLWAASAGFLDAFEEQWALSGVLCSVSPSGSLVLAL
ncbi:hypothetical protein G0U57_014491 [Chelydra serpentina]|uniref:Uncharacterized protein n=1 Tax=Chelydra serpentina TaxID=8475 RepID=A0A8T1S9B0_CHESE|nr:hypothetical protein G0U57_014491 [Chelydra serpentina]